VSVPTGLTIQDDFIPNDYPFLEQVGVNEELFAIGLRSPHHMTLDGETGRISSATSVAGIARK
jgi:hypothetical protein